MLLIQTRQLVVVKSNLLFFSHSRHLKPTGCCFLFPFPWNNTKIQEVYIILYTKIQCFLNFSVYTSVCVHIERERGRCFLPFIKYTKIIFFSRMPRAFNDHIPKAIVTSNEFSLFSGEERIGMVEKYLDASQSTRGQSQCLQKQQSLRYFYLSNRK